MSKYKYVFGHVTKTNLVYELLAIKAYSDTILKFKEYNYDNFNYNKTNEQLFELNNCIRSDMRAKLSAANSHFIDVVSCIKDYLSEFIDYQINMRNCVNDGIKRDMYDYISNQLACVTIDRDLSYINLMGAIRKLEEYICNELAGV